MKSLDLLSLSRLWLSLQWLLKKSRWILSGFFLESFCQDSGHCS
uniref:Uncharacterized protein n=1 Tax=Anguilla anguilla TaxID=7936 RepID=A0A0E9RT22_ANGAN